MRMRSGLRVSGVVGRTRSRRWSAPRSAAMRGVCSPWCATCAWCAVAAAMMAVCAVKTVSMPKSASSAMKRWSGSRCDAKVGGEKS